MKEQDQVHHEVPITGGGHFNHGGALHPIRGQCQFKADC